MEERVSPMVDKNYTHCHLQCTPVFTDIRSSFTRLSIPLLTAIKISQSVVLSLTIGSADASCGFARAQD